MHQDPSRHTGTAASSEAADDLFLRIARAVSQPIDENFFDALTRRVTEALSVAGGVIAVLDSTDRSRLRTRALILDEESLENLSYPVAGTPCEAIVQGESRVFEQRLREQFPNHPLFARFDLEAYAGTPVRNRTGKVIGLVAVLNNRPFQNPERVQSALWVVAGRVAAELERRKSEQRLALTHFALNHTHEAMYLIDQDARFVDVNDAACRALGYTRKELMGLTLPDIDPTFTLEHWRQHWAIIRQQGSLKLEGIHRRKDGSTFPTEISANYFDYDGRGYDLAVVRDITENKRNELIRDTETGTLKLITEGATLQTILDAIARGVEALIPGALASILLLDPDGVHLRHGATPGLPEAYQRAIDGIAIGPAVGTCGTALFRREPVIVTDIDRDPLWDECRDLVKPFGLRSCWSTPVMDSLGTPLASLAVYHRQPKKPTTADFELVVTLTELIGIAIERHRQAQALRASEQRFRQLAEHIEDVFWITDANGRGLYISPAYERIWGLPCDGLYQDEGQWFRAIHEADRPRMAEAVRRIDSGDDPEGHQSEYRIVRPDGTLRWIIDRSFPIRDESGAVYRLVGVARDITARKEAELALEERIKELRCLYRVLELTTDETRSVTAICADIAALLPSSLAHENQGVARIVVDDQEHRSENWQPPVSALRSSISDGDRSIGYVELGYRVEGLDQGAAGGPFLDEERTLLDSIAVHIQRMIHNRRMADTLARAQRMESVGQLTGGIAHDFNNLLTVILGNAELLGEELSNDPRLQPLAEMVVQGAQRGAELTQRLLAFARKQALEPKPVDINQLVTGMDKLLRRTLGEHIEITQLHAPDLWPALVDPGQLESALLNLSLNARDAMPQGGRLIIETSNTRLDEDYAGRHVEVQPGEYVRITVSDTGEGIAPEHLVRIFEPFYTTKDTGKGTGLGLPMVYGFVKQSRGHIKLHSEPGEGTTVKVYLPRVVQNIQQEPDSTEATEVTGGTETILLVEDQALVLEYAEIQLRKLGYRVLTATNGPEALEIIHQRSDIDLLFTDIVMPGGMNGRELADTARAIRKDLKVLYTSGYSESAIIHHGRLDPGVHLLSKPYRRNELAHRIRQALNEQ